MLPTTLPTAILTHAPCSLLPIDCFDIIYNLFDDNNVTSASKPLETESILYIGILLIVAGVWPLSRKWRLIMQLLRASSENFMRLRWGFVWHVFTYDTFRPYKGG